MIWKDLWLGKTLTMRMLISQVWMFVEFTLDFLGLFKDNFFLANIFF